MPYEHPLIFGAREYFWDDATFHDDCIGIHIDETQVWTREELLDDPPCHKTFRTCSSQTEPWAPPQAAANAGTRLLARPKPGIDRPNRKFRPDRMKW